VSDDERPFGSKWTRKVLLPDRIRPGYLRRGPTGRASYGDAAMAEKIGRVRDATGQLKVDDAGWSVGVMSGGIVDGREK